MVSVKQVKLGHQGLQVSELGLGCMGMSMMYGPPKPEKDMIEVIKQAVDLGITFFDTSDAYGPHTNELLIGKSVKGIREKVQIATKFGIIRDEEGSMVSKGDPDYVRSCLEGSLKRLDIDCIDLYYYHRVDTSVPIEVTVEVLKGFVEAGKVKYIGLSEVSSSEIRRAHAVHPITAVQLEWSLWTRDVEDDIIPTCRELGIGIVPYCPIGRGFFYGVKTADLADGDYRKVAPRSSMENYEKNRKLYDRLVEIGKRHNKTAGQLALAWVQNQGGENGNVVSIPGTTNIEHLKENIGALDLKLSKEEMKEIEAAFPHTEVAGARYNEAMMKSMTWRYLTSAPLSSWKGKA